MERVLEVISLTKIFDGKYALDGVSFSLRKGEFLAVIGPNGAGKTTLLNCILGLVRPTSGRIIAFGLELERHRKEVLRHMNFASNYVGLPLSLTVMENLTVYGLLYRVRDIKRKAEELLKLLGIWELRDHKTRHLSSGQMMRLCLAKALLNDPRILLLDEPTAGLDPEIAARVRALIKEFQTSRGLSVVFTSHNLAEVEDLSDRVIFLYEGRILAEGSPEELCRAFGAKDLEEAFFSAISAGGRKR